MPTALPARTRIVQSPANRWVKALRAALAHPPALAREPYAAGEAPLLALEGFHLIAEALLSGATPAALFLRSGEEHGALETLMRLCSRQPAGGVDQGVLQTVPRSVLALSPETELLALPPALFASLVATDSPQPIAALVPAPSYARDALLLAANTAGRQRSNTQRRAPLLLVLAALQDPGNVGTLLRSAEAFGATGAFLLAGTASPWGPKALRASAGSALRLPLVALSHGGEAALLLRRQGIRSWAAVPAGGVPPGAAALDRASALWIGNEGAGLSVRDLEACDGRISLPMDGPTESLNAAVAGSLLLYEAARQRTGSASSNAIQQLAEQAQA